MKCPYCDGVLGDKDTCEKCSKNVAIFKKAFRASNNFYNRGLKKAKVRDLSGAVIDLRKSLKLYKKNTDARNLLGLVYYEMGEAVAALSEWVISKHFQPEGNEMAERYLDDIQASPAKIDNFNQSFKKFNLALQAAKQNNEDLAVIHLKKVISLNPHFLRAMHLMALIYMHQGEKEKAKKVLKRAAKVDISNTVTLSYLSEVEVIDETREYPSKSLTDDIESIDNSLTKMSLGSLDSYREEKPNVMAYVNLIIGILIGLGVTFFLVVPDIQNKNEEKASKTSITSSDSLAASTTKLESLASENESLKKDITNRDKELTDLKNQLGGGDGYDALFTAFRLYNAGDKEAAASAVSKVDMTKIQSEDANVLYEFIKNEVYGDVVDQLASEGKQLCNSGKMEEALVPLLKAYGLTQDNESVLYFLGRSYQKLNQKEEAKKYFDQLIAKFPNASRTATAKKRLREMGFTVE